MALYSSGSGSGVSVVLGSEVEVGGGGKRGWGLLVLGFFWGWRPCRRIPAMTIRARVDLFCWEMGLSLSLGVTVSGAEMMLERRFREVFLVVVRVGFFERGREESRFGREEVLEVRERF